VKNKMIISSGKIETLSITKENKMLINDSVLVWFLDGKLSSSFDKNLISLDESLILIKQYIKDLSNKLNLS
jgi:hypothetical protein